MRKLWRKCLTFLGDKKYTIVRIQMARTGRPKAENPKTKKVDVRLTEYEYARLKEYAKRHNQTLAQTLRLEVEKMIASL